MNGYSFVMAVIRREQDEDYIEFFKKNGAAVVYSTLCEGAARMKTLDMLGLEQKEKRLLCCVIPTGARAGLIRQLKNEMYIDAPNNGIALFIPLDSIGGTTAVRRLCRETEHISCEVREMEKTRFSLITVIAEKGHTGLIMDAARQAGAAGGTIIKAKGTGAEGAAKFFGVSIANEKEMVYIVASAEQKDGIMASIMKNAGKNSPAQSVVFSLPVDAVCGMKLAAED